MASDERGSKSGRQQSEVRIHIHRFRRLRRNTKCRLALSEAEGSLSCTSFPSTALRTGGIGMTRKGGEIGVRSWVSWVRFYEDWDQRDNEIESTGLFSRGTEGN